MRTGTVDRMPWSPHVRLVKERHARFANLLYEISRLGVQARIDHATDITQGNGRICKAIAQQTTIDCTP